MQRHAVKDRAARDDHLRVMNAPRFGYHMPLELSSLVIRIEALDHHHVLLGAAHAIPARVTVEDEARSQVAGGLVGKQGCQFVHDQAVVKVSRSV
jgi:hypothetical protein